MAQADNNPTTNLSKLIRDPFVRSAFERAERDLGDDCLAEIDNPPSLDSGAAELLTGSGVRRVLAMLEG